MDRKGVIRRLAGQLPDRILLELFPDQAPDLIRHLLDPERFPPPVSSPGDAMAGSRTCTLYTDGASRGNPGQAGAGFVILDDKGTELRAEARYLGHCTNNVAEYKALILGLETARAEGCEHLRVRMDSELIVHQINGRYRVKNANLRPLYEQAKKLLTGFASVTVSHVARAENRRADQLANQGIDRHRSAGCQTPLPGTGTGA